MVTGECYARASKSRRVVSAKCGSGDTAPVARLAGSIREVRIGRYRARSEICTHEVRVGRAVAPVARFPRRRAKFDTAILKFGTDKITNGTDKNENGTDTLSTCRSSVRGWHFHINHGKQGSLNSNVQLAHMSGLRDRSFLNKEL